MIVVVIGAGAVGSFLGWTLRSAGHEVTLVVRPEGGPESGSGELQTHRDLSLVDSDGKTRTLDVAIARMPDNALPSPDLVLLAVKMPDLASAIDVAAAWPAATILAVENGVGADELIVSRRPGGDVLAGSLTTPVSLERGVIRRRSKGGIGLAAVRDLADGARLQDLAATMSAGGLRARVLPDARAMRWSKLLANLVGNATSAILDVDPAAVYADPRLFAVERRQLREALEVMRRLELRLVALPGADVRPLAFAMRLPPAIARPVLQRVVTGARGGKSPSLRLAVRSGAQTEVDWLQGAVARTAIELDGRAPVNQRLADLVRECGSNPDSRAWFQGRPDRLLAALG